MAALATLPTLLVPHGAWVVDTTASRVRFRVRHLGFAPVTGRFTAFSARVDERSIRGSVAVRSLDTGQPLRDARLLSGEFFDAMRFPQITFRAAGPLASPLGGHLAIRDVARPVVFEITSSPSDAGRIGLHAAAVISRKAFGLEWSALREAGRLVVSDRVDLLLDLVLRPQETSQP